MRRWTPKPSRELLNALAASTEGSYSTMPILRDRTNDGTMTKEDMRYQHVLK